MTTVRGTRRGPTDAARARRGKNILGRVGLVGKAAVFTIVGLLAIQLATGDAGTDTSRNGAVEWLAAQPFGRFLLVALTVALFALAAWRLLDAVMGDPVEGSEAGDRAKFAVQGVTYLSLAVAALATTIANWSKSGTSGGGGSGSGEQATATVLEWPAGRWIVITVGAVVIALAVHLFKKHTIDQQFLQRMDVGHDSWVAVAGRAGYAARSVVYVVIGYFLVQAGVTHQAGKTRGMSGALQELSGKGWGQWVLWGVAIGLLAFGIFTFAEAKYRKAA